MGPQQLTIRPQQLQWDHNSYNGTTAANNEVTMVPQQLSIRPQHFLLIAKNEAMNEVPMLMDGVQKRVRAADWAPPMQLKKE